MNGTLEAFAGSIVAICAAAAAADTINVPGDVPTIQGAIDVAVDGDTVMVAAGVYPEHILLKSGVSVIGEDRATTIIDGGGVAIDVVSAISVEDVVFRGFTVTGATGGGLPGGAGVFVNFPSATVVIVDVISDGNGFGVAVFNAFLGAGGPDILDSIVRNSEFDGISNPGIGLMSGNLIYSNGRDGINISGNSVQAQIIGNTIWGNVGDGINYWNDFAPTIQNNILAANDGFGIEERAPGTFVDPIVEHNLFWDNGLGNYFDVQSGTTADTAVQINALANVADNLVGDPLLCDPPDDFHPAPRSPAAGAGLNGADIGALPVQECGCTGDFTGDDMVGINDLLVLLSAWGTPGGDLTGDGLTNVQDLLVLLANWGSCS